MSMMIADATLGLDPQARAVLAMLSSSECDGLAEYDERFRDYKIEIHTSAWYNGRERGICLVVRASFTSKRAMLLTFGECRNSDLIFVDSWVVERYFLNPPTLEDFTDEAYEQRTYVSPGNIGEAVQVIRGKIGRFMVSEIALADASKSPLPARVLPELGDDEHLAKTHRA